MVVLAELPPLVLASILHFLPQHLLLNLALTNFVFYEPCLKQLYRRINIQLGSVLRNDRPASPHQRLDFLELCVTTVCGFRDVALRSDAHGRLVAAKLHTLTRSLLVNPTLAGYIEQVLVLGPMHECVRVELEAFLKVLVHWNIPLHSVYISDPNLRYALRHLWTCFPLSSVVVDSGLLFTSFSLRKYTLQEIVVAEFPKDLPVDGALVPVLENIRSLKISSAPQVYLRFLAYLSTLFRAKPFVMKNLRTFTMVVSHHLWQLPFLPTAGLENLQLSLGCEDPTCGMQCLTSALGNLQLHKLKRLSVIEMAHAGPPSHKISEQWDLIVFDFIKSVVQSCPSLFYLSIRHNVPADGIIDDGFEGNYLRKVKLYTNVLPSILGQIKNHIVNLVLPQLVSVLACYEQAMNTFLWNGCKCDHCSVILDKLDEYLLYHRYFSPEKHVFKDMQTVQLVRTMGEVLSERLSHDQNLGDLFLLETPMKNVGWDFHSNKIALPFRCLPMKTYEMAEMEDDTAEEPFFDAEDTENDCKFLRRESFMPQYPIVVSHYLDDLIRRMINLNRGDAEDADINRASYENDGFTNLRINKMVINGIDFNFDHEPNGTIFFTNSYDQVSADCT